MAKFVLFVGLVGVFLSGPAFAVPIDWGMESPSNHFLRVTLFADDGFSQASDHVDVVGFNSRIAGDVSGIISPVLTLDSIQYSFDNLSLAFTIGASNIPVSVNFGGSFGVSGIYEASSVMGTTDGFTTFQAPSTSFPNVHFSGTLDVPFGSLPFDVSGPSTHGTALSTVWANDLLLPSATQSVGLALMEADRAQLVTHPHYTSSFYGIGWSNSGARQQVGTVGGVNWSIGVAPMSPSGSAVYTPEPSTALLLGIGLAGLAARKRV